MKLNSGKTALTLGSALAGFHLVWAALVLIGVAQPLMDFVLWAHMIHFTYTVGPFDLTATIALLAFTFVMGYAMGYCFAKLWNKLHRN